MIEKQLLLTSQRFIEQKQYWQDKLSLTADNGEVGCLYQYLNMNGYTRDAGEPGSGTASVEIRFPAALNSRLIELGNGSELTIYIILLSLLKTLIYRYSGRENTVVASPVYEPNVTEDTLNDFVLIRNSLAGDPTFKDLLLGVSRTVGEAYRNQDYPMEELVESDIPGSIACFLKNIHDERKVENFSSRAAFSFVFDREQNRLRGAVHCQIYDVGEEERFYPEQLSRHFTHLAEQLVEHIDARVSRAELLSEPERQQLLLHFNDTRADYPREKLIHELYEEQAARTPDAAAVIDMAQGPGRGALTYGELNETSRRLAGELAGKGVQPGAVVGIMVERSLEMVVGILGILKAGGAYLPIDPEYPEERRRFMLTDSSAKVLVTANGLIEQGAKKEITFASSHLPGPQSLAYIIYTSGSTGKPKGIMVEHRNVVRLVKSTSYIEFREKDRLLLTGNFIFDITTFEIWGPLLNGSSLYLAGQDIILDSEKLKAFLAAHRISILHLIPQLFNQLASSPGGIEVFTGLRYLLTGGDLVSPRYINEVRNTFNYLRILHMYGPTENTTFSTSFSVEKEYEKRIPIGKPIANSSAYILGESEELSPIGVAGELVVGGDGVARGYLNNPELTAERFSRGATPSNILTPYPLPFTRFYRTGDLARWLPDGSIEFLGRLDHQVKIRGFRIETGEIEHYLLKHDSVEEALVVCRENRGEKNLCAYVVGSGGIVNSSVLREYLSGMLPDFMIPGFFVAVDAFPLNRNGKVDIRALPEPAADTGRDDFTAPRTGTEKALVAVWADVLDIPGENIGIDANFFELGGHSLKISILIARIHKAFNVKIELADVFMIQTIRELAEYIDGAETDLYTAIESAPEKEFYALSSAQKRLYFLNRRDPDDTGYNMPMVLVLNERVCRDKLEVAFRQLIRRHESLRTAFIMIGDTPVQRIYPGVNFQIEYYGLTGKSGCSGETGWSPHTVKILHDFVKPFDLSRAPLLRVGLIRESEQTYTMIVDIHHIISDGTSHDILAREFAALYAGRELPPLKLRYRDYSEWQKNFAVSETVLKQKEFWLKQFEDNIPVLNLPIDYPRPLYRDAAGVRILTGVPESLVWKLKRLALNLDTTLYTVLLTAFTLLLARISGQDDIVVGSPVSGRTHADLHPIIGLFANMLPMRNRPQEDKSLSDFILEVKENALRAFENQDFQFDQLVNVLKIKRDPGRHPLFDAVLALQNVGPTGEDRKKPGILENFNVVPYPYRQLDVQHDFLVMAEERGGKMDILLEYAVALFKPETVDEIWNHFIDVLEQVGDAENLQLPLKNIRLSHDAVVISQENEEEGDFNF